MDGWDFEVIDCTKLQDVSRASEVDWQPRPMSRGVAAAEIEDDLGLISLLLFALSGFEATASSWRRPAVDTVGRVFIAVASANESLRRFDHCQVRKFRIVAVEFVLTVTLDLLTTGESV